MKHLDLSRKLIKKTDIIWIAMVLVICSAVMFFTKPVSKDNIIAQISYCGKVIKNIDLTSAENQTFTLSENPNVSFLIEDHKIRFFHTNCPDKLCEKTGFLSKPNQIAVCLPNKVSLKIVSYNSQIDAVVY